MQTILVVEDNPDNLLLVEEMLDDEGYQIQKATDAEQGIAVLHAHHVDLVLMDISLPRMSGLQAIRIIRADEQLKAIPIVALTAFAMKSDYDAALSAGSDAYLTKPVDESMLLSTIHRLLQ